MKALLFPSLLITVCLAAPVSAQTFSWGNTPNPEIDGEGLPDPNFQEMSFDSTGTAIDSSGSTFTFELGTFKDDFNPGVGNVDMWGTKWEALGSASYSPTLNYFTAGYTLTPADAALAGSRAYIWIYNDKIGDETSEWFLGTGDTAELVSNDNNWIVPDYAPPGSSYSWRLSTANTAVWGGLNNDGTGTDQPNEDVGAGIFSVTPATYEFQTFLVPEPSALALVGFGLALGLRRRRR